MAIGDDFEVQTDKDIRHVGAGTTVYSIYNLDLWLQGLADDASAAGDDNLYIASPDPSSIDGLTSSIKPLSMNLLNGFNIDDTTTQYLNYGSIAQNSGDDLYTGVVTIGSQFLASSPVQILQNGSKLTKYWADGHIRILVKAKSGGTLIDSGDAWVFSRKYPNTYSDFNINLAAGGEQSAALSTTTTDWNTLSLAQAQALSTKVAFTFTDTTQDAGDGNGSLLYKGTITLSGGITIEEAAQYCHAICDQDSTTSINGIAGWNWRKLHADYAPNSSAPFGGVAGGVWFVAQGWWVAGYLTADTLNFKMISHNGTSTGNPPPPVEYGLSISGLIAGSQVVVYETGTTTELDRDDNTGTTYEWIVSGAAADVDYTIQRAGYLPQRFVGIALSSVQASIGNQVVDRAYATSSGITFGTTGAVTVGTKVFGLTTVSSGKNWYSFLIESWIAQSSLRNVDFPVSHDGDESFTLEDGWEFSSTNWSNLRRCGIRYLSISNTLTATFAGLLSIGDIGGNTAQIQQSDGGDQVSAADTGDIDQLLQVYGDSTHGNFDRTGHLVAKAQVNGYLTPAYDIIADGGLSTLADKLYSFPLNLVASGIATGDPSITGVTITDHAGSPVTWNSKVFSITITDSGTNSGADIAKWISYNLAQGGTFQGKAAFNWHDMVLPNGDGYKTIRGPIYGDTGAAIKGVRVLRGTDPHPDFNMYTADDGTTYSPPEVASVTLTNVTAGSMVQIYDTTASEELYLGTGPYYWNETYSADRAIRIRVMWVDGADASIFLEANIGSITEANPQLTYLVNQVTDNVYAANAVDGSTILGITIDDATLLINVDTSSISLADIYAYETYWLSTEEGIIDETRVITAVDTANYIFSNFKIKNTGIGPLVITGGYMQDADTGTALDIIDITGGTIFLAPDHVVPYAAGAEATVAIVQSGLTAQGYTGTRAGKIDTIDTLATRSAFSDKVIKNKRVITAGKELVVYDDDNTTPILQKSLKDISGAAIADLATGVLAQEIASSV